MSKSITSADSLFKRIKMATEKQTTSTPIVKVDEHGTLFRIEQIDFYGDIRERCSIANELLISIKYKEDKDIYDGIHTACNYIQSMCENKYQDVDFSFYICSPNLISVTFDFDSDDFQEYIELQDGLMNYIKSIGKKYVKSVTMNSAIEYC